MALKCELDGLPCQPAKRVHCTVFAAVLRKPICRIFPFDRSETQQAGMKRSVQMKGLTDLIEKKKKKVTAKKWSLCFKGFLILWATVTQIEKWQEPIQKHLVEYDPRSSFLVDCWLVHVIPF